MNSNEIACISVIALTVVIAFLVFIVVYLKNRTKKDLFTNGNEIKTVMEKSLYSKAIKKSDTWFSISVLWIIVEYLGVILPFELSAAILYLENTSDMPAPRTIITFSVLSMALIIMVYAIRPHEHMQGYRRAYVILDYAIGR